jgi:hypothetical protein
MCDLTILARGLGAASLWQSVGVDTVVRHGAMAFNGRRSKGGRICQCVGRVSGVAGRCPQVVGVPSVVPMWPIAHRLSLSRVVLGDFGVILLQNRPRSY